MAQPATDAVTAAESFLPEKKKANRTLETVGFLLRIYCRREFAAPEGVRVTFPACALAKTSSSSKNLACGRGTRASKRPARRVFDRVETLARGDHDRVLALCQPVNGQCPTAVKHV
jgi:hypothetical protein